MIYLVRHGQTEFNAAGRWQGQVDSPLTQLGISQASRVAETLHRLVNTSEVAIFSSPLGRAQHTAKIIAEKLGKPDDIILDPRLMEVGMGSWDGLTDVDIEYQWPNARAGLDRHEWFFHSPNGETYEVMSTRVNRALKIIREHSAPIKIIVSHGVTGRILRGLHSNTPRDESLRLDVPQDAIFRLSGDGCIELIAC